MRVEVLCMAFTSSALQCAKTPISEGVWIVSGGVGMVSGWGLRVSGNVHIYTKSVGKEIILGHGTQILSFIPVPCIA